MAEYADEADYAVEPVSDPEKLVIAEHMLMSSPPGQFWDVLTGKLLIRRYSYIFWVSRTVSGRFLSSAQ